MQLSGVCEICGRVCYDINGRYRNHVEFIVHDYDKEQQFGWKSRQVILCVGECQKVYEVIDHVKMHKTGV